MEPNYSHTGNQPETEKLPYPLYSSCLRKGKLLVSGLQPCPAMVTFAKVSKRSDFVPHPRTLSILPTHYYKVKAAFKIKCFRVNSPYTTDDRYTQNSYLAEVNWYLQAK
ncbi:UNVERIFIED_CONTAM: hypothetical protein K2H54_056641 [Gekko kuhli]